MFVVTTSVVLFSDVCSNDFSRYPMFVLAIPPTASWGLLRRFDVRRSPNIKP
ncbi:MAG: hypothetical protein ACRC8Y_14040 [Chroococcales cyanobacterium]